MPHKNNQTVGAPSGSLKVPDELRPLAEPSLPRSGENPRAYEVRQMIVDDIQPNTNIEWLCTLDRIELSWGLFRNRGLKKSILNVHRATATADFCDDWTVTACLPASCQWSILRQKDRKSLCRRVDHLRCWID